MRSSKSREHYLRYSTGFISKKSYEGVFISVKNIESIVINELNRMSREFLDMDETAQKIEIAKNRIKRGFSAFRFCIFYWIRIKMILIILLSIDFC